MTTSVKQMMEAANAVVQKITPAEARDSSGSRDAWGADRTRLCGPEYSHPRCEASRPPTIPAS